MSTEEILRKYISDNILHNENGYPYTDHDSFFDNQILDSTDILELVMFLEEEYSIFIEDDEITRENFDSVGNLASFIQGKIDHVST